MKKIQWSILMMGMVIINTIIQADTIIMKNGDSLSGRMVKNGRNAVTFKPELATVIRVPWRNIRTLQSSGQVVILKADGTLEEGMLSLHDGVAAAGSLELGPEDVLHPEDWEVGKAWKNTGTVNLSLRFERGNAKKDDLNLDVATGFRCGSNRMAVRGEWDVDERNNEKSKDKWLAQSDYNRFLNEEVYTSASVNAEADEFAELRLRTTLGAGVGWQVFEETKRKLHLEGLANRIREELRDEADEEFWGLGWNIGYEQQLSRDKEVYYFDSKGSVDPTDAEQVLGRIRTGLRVPIHENLSGTLEYKLDYDASPPGEVEDVVETYRAKVGYSW